MFPSYEETIQGLGEKLRALEQQRLMIVRRLQRHLIAMLLALLATIACIVIISVLAPFFIIGFIVYVIIAIVLLTKQYRLYRTKFKKVIVAGVMEQLVTRCQLPHATDRFRYESHYDPKLRVSDADIKNSRLFNFGIDEIEGEDLFYGVLGLTEFKFSEIELIQIQTSTDSKGHTTRTRVTMFDGILFIADFHKEFAGVTILREASVFNSGKVGRMLQPFRNLMSVFAKEKKRPIQLENEDFNRAFHVETTDDVTARYILSPSMMERILTFKNQHNKRIEISFVHSLMYVALSSGRNHFEPKLYDSIKNVQAQIVYDDLVFLFSLIEQFDLNTRIWSKE